MDRGIYCMELEGKLRATTFPELLQFLSTGKKTGTLTFKSGERKTSLMIKEGKIINTANEARSRRLGEMLVNRGFIRRSVLEDVLAQQQSETQEKLLGELLIENELISNDILKEVLRLQLEEEVWSLFGWEEGTFQFTYSKDKHFSNILVELDVEPFLLEGSRRLDEWSKIARNIKNENLVPVIVPFSLDDFEKEITLSESEWRVLSLINGFYNVGSLVARSGLSKFETFRILNSFLVAGLIEIKEHDEILETVEEVSETDDEGEKATEQEGAEAEQGKEEEPPEPSPEKPKKKRGLKLSFKMPFRRPVVEEKKVETLNFFSPVGVVCFFFNKLFQKLEKRDDFIASDKDHELLKILWRETLMNHPRADLVYAADNSLEFRDLEYFIDSVGLESNIVFSCYEETMAALKSLLSHVEHTLTLRLGEKTAQRNIYSLANELDDQITLDHDSAFSIRDFVKKNLKTDTVT